MNNIQITGVYIYLLIKIGYEVNIDIFISNSQFSLNLRLLIELSCNNGTIYIIFPSSSSCFVFSLFSILKYSKQFCQINPVQSIRKSSAFNPYHAENIPFLI
jgi:hypothetical protein